MKHNHELKSWPRHVAAIVGGRKTFDVRYDDRGYEVGQVVLLREYCPELRTHSGRRVTARISYVERGPAPGIPANYVILGLSDVKLVKR